MILTKQQFMKKHIKKLLNLRSVPKRNVISKAFEELFDGSDVNICFNESIPEQYDESQKNVLVCIESPAYATAEGWFRDDREWYGEVSFLNYYNLDNYYCPRRIYSTMDNFVKYEREDSWPEKCAIPALIFSNKIRLDGHQLRHKIAVALENSLALFGPGANRPFKYKREVLSNRAFAVIIENGKYPEYVSEKFFDCIKTGTVPLYRGGETAVKKMGFDLDGVLCWDTVNELSSLIDTVSMQKYESLKPAVKYNHRRLGEVREQVRIQYYLDSVRHHFMLEHVEGNQYKHSGSTDLNIRLT